VKNLGAKKNVRNESFSDKKKTTKIFKQNSRLI